MAILDFNATTNAPTRNQRQTPFNNLSGADANANRPKAQVWLNIGYEAGGKFINLPIGLPVDTMEPAALQGQNPDWLKQRSAQNGLLEGLKKLGLSLQPGEEQQIQLQVRIRRVSEAAQAVAAEENEYALDFSQLLMPVTAAAE